MHSGPSDRRLPPGRDARDEHELFLDGTKVWSATTPDGVALVNDRVHEAQFSVGSRLQGFARWGGQFNWLGFGNWFGYIGDIRISDVARYQ